MGPPDYWWVGWLCLRAGIRLYASLLLLGLGLVSPPGSTGGQLCEVEPVANSWERMQEAFLWTQA